MTDPNASTVAVAARRRLRLVLLVLLLATATACASLPVSGPVHRQPAERSDRQPEAAYFNPPGPAQDGSPAAIVSGFLVAMQANPLSTSVARSFLSEHARSTWQPNRGTIVYEAFTVQPTSAGAEVRLTDTRRLDSRGGWRGGAPGSEDLDLHLVSEDGQWRIDNPVDALVVPTSYFERSFARFDLYFPDQTDRVLLPDPVFIPRGEQTATNLVRGLLAGPGAALTEVSRSAFPARTALDLSVVVTESGIAEVPLSREMLKLAPPELALVAAQLAWTLRQVPGVQRVRVSVAGAPVPLVGGRTDVPVSLGGELDAGGSAEGTTLWGLRGGRVVDAESPSDSPAPGPLGKSGFSMRSLAVSDVPRTIAAVSGNGSTVFVAPADKAATGAPGALVAKAFSKGRDLLRPAYDMFGDLWLVDRTPRGARVYVLHAQQLTEVRVSGVTGAAVAALAVARDGARLAVALSGSAAPEVRIANILRTDDGVFSGIGSVRRVGPDLGDGARIADLGWRDPSTLAVLSRTGGETSQVSFVSADGSPPSPALAEPAVFRGPAGSLVVAPDGNVPMRLVTTDQRLYTLTPSGQWSRSSSKVVAAAYGQ